MAYGKELTAYGEELMAYGKELMAYGKGWSLMAYGVETYDSPYGIRGKVLLECKMAYGMSYGALWHAGWSLYGILLRTKRKSC